MGTKGLALVLCSFQRAGMRRKHGQSTFSFSAPCYPGSSFASDPFFSPILIPPATGIKIFSPFPFSTHVLAALKP